MGLARGQRADVAASAVLSRLADAAEAQVAGAIEGADPECLHDLRVAVRRARSVLREFKGVFPAGPRAELRAELKWVQTVTGPVRDLDVQLEGWPGGEELQPLHALLVQRREAALAELRELLRGDRFAGALARWRALAALTPGSPEDGRPNAGRPVEKVAAKRVRSVYRRMVRDGGRIGDGSPDEDLHDLRKRGKELRYLLELFGSLFPEKVVKPMVKALKRLQDVLGGFQDGAVQAEQMRALGAEAPGLPGVDAAVGAALDAQAAARGDFAKRFARFASKKQRKRVKRTF